MDKYLVCILLCIVQRLSVNGQMLVTDKVGVVISASSQQTPSLQWDIDHIVDGNANTDADNCNCCGATGNDLNAWYQVDLGQEYTLQRIHVIGRAKYQHTLYKMEIQLGTTEPGGTVLQGPDTSDIFLRELNYTLTFLQVARFVTLTLRDITQHFLICELYVYAVCTEGKYGPECVNTCGKCKNSEPCDGLTGACSECLTGYQSPMCQVCTEGKYGPECVKTCGKCKNSEPCDGVTGACLECLTGYQSPLCKVCTEGKYGPECINSCGKCKNSEPCDGVTGACSECLTGYHSPLCKDCSDHLYGPTCEECGHCYNNDVCDKVDGTCTRGCSAGYQGTKCDQVCSSGKYGVNCSYSCGNCESSAACNSVDGACTACVPGYILPMCKDCIDGRYSSTCNEECGNCTNNDVCDKTNGNCPSGCSAGYQGTKCQEVCSLGTYGPGCAYTCGRCENNATCNNVDGECTGCVTGYLSPMCKDCITGRYGPTCNEECGHCINNDTCDNSNGSCPNGCYAGYKGNICKQACSWGKYGISCAQTCGNCKNNQTCDTVNGTCGKCVPDYLSPMCKDCIDERYGTTCNEVCGQCINTDVCDKSNGNCQNGCSAGYNGTTCKQECEDGTFGLGCQEKCGKCFNNGPCNTMDGSCASCAAGYKGNTCLNECQAGTFGFNCKQRCGMCQDGDVCDIYTGECPNGCTDEYKGSKCSQEINQDTSISLPVFIGSLFAVIVLTITIVIGIVWLIYRKRLNKKTHKAANNEDTSIPLPNTPSNYDTLKFDNPNGESTYTELNRRS